MSFVINNALVPATLPAAFCTWTAQAQVNWLMANTQIVSNTSFDNLLIQADEPNPDQRDKAWLRLVGADLGPDKLYKYALGAWISQHPVPASGEQSFLWRGTEVGLETYDGGEAGPVTATTGPMWEVDHEFDGRVPVGPGTIPGSDPVATVSVATNTGEASHQLTAAELPASITLKATLDGFRTNLETLEPQWLSPTAATGGGFPTDPPTGEATFQFTNDAAADKLQMLPAARGIFFIKRTARIYFRAT